MTLGRQAEPSRLPHARTPAPASPRIRSRLAASAIPSWKCTCASTDATPSGHCSRNAASGGFEISATEHRLCAWETETRLQQGTEKRGPVCLRRGKSELLVSHPRANAKPSRWQLMVNRILSNSFRNTASQGSAIGVPKIGLSLSYLRLRLRPATRSRSHARGAMRVDCVMSLFMRPGMATTLPAIMAR